MSGWVQRTLTPVVIAVVLNACMTCLFRIATFTRILVV